LENWTLFRRGKPSDGAPDDFQHLSGDSMIAIIPGSPVYDFARDSVAFDATSSEGSIRFWVSRKVLLTVARASIEHADDLLGEFERHNSLIQVAVVWKLNTLRMQPDEIELTSADIAKVTHILPPDSR